MCGSVVRILKEVVVDHVLTLMCGSVVSILKEVVVDHVLTHLLSLNVLESYIICIFVQFVYSKY